MCTVCGCGGGETRIEGKAPEQDALPAQTGSPAHDHAAADGSIIRPPPATADGWHQHGDGKWHRHGPSHAYRARPVVPPAAPEPGDAPAADLHFGAGPAGAHAPGLSQRRMVQIEADILGHNDALAAANRQHLASRAVLAINLLSGPGAGKTRLLTRTLSAMSGAHPLAVIEGDQETALDAERIRATGVPALQINTGKGCHLDAAMVGRALAQMELPAGGILFIENVGNLVCPAAFDLGATATVLILSVTEGADKPLKYPDIFHAADLLLINKTDLLPHVDFDLEQAVTHARRIKPGLPVIALSASTGEGCTAWLDWLGARLTAVRQARIGQLEAELAALKGA